MKQNSLPIYEEGETPPSTNKETFMKTILKKTDLAELMEEYIDLIAQEHPPVTLHDKEWPMGEVFREMEPQRFNIALHDYIDYLIKEESLERIGKDYYRRIPLTLLKC